VCQSDIFASYGVVNWNPKMAVDPQNFAQVLAAFSKPEKTLLTRKVIRFFLVYYALQYLVVCRTPRAVFKTRQVSGASFRVQPPYSG